MNEFKTPLEVRLACRRNELQGAASSALSGYLCVNIVMMDKEHADDFVELQQMTRIDTWHVLSYQNLMRGGKRITLVYRQL